MRIVWIYSPFLVENSSIFYHIQDKGSVLFSSQQLVGAVINSPFRINIHQNVKPENFVDIIAYSNVSDQITDFLFTNRYGTQPLPLAHN